MPKSINKVLIPLDHSEPSLEAAWLGLTIASLCRASLTLIHVQEKATLELFYVNYLEMDDLSHNSFHDLILKYVDDPYSDALCSPVNSGILEIDFEPCGGKPPVEICKYAKANGIDLIVMGSRGQSKFKESLIGSVSSEVLHNASCPVTIVR